MIRLGSFVQQLAVAATLLVLTPHLQRAHEIPASVSLMTFVKPENNLLRVVVRVPLESIRDIEFPLIGTEFLDITASNPLLSDAARLWIADYLHIEENGVALGNPRIAATRIALPNDRTFSSYDSALAGVAAAPLQNDVALPWRQALFDVLLEYPIASADARFAIDSRLAHLGVRTSTVLRFLPPGGGERVLQFTGYPGLVYLDPSWFQAAALFTAQGFKHILGGLDHILFLLCLVIPFRKVRHLAVIVTAFTVAHSITLVASAFGMAPTALWFAPFIETLVALSILFMAFENIIGARLERRWLIAFAFGLIHGFAFSFFLRDSLQFAGAHVTTSLLTFNLGVELGQLALVLVAVPVLALLFKHVVPEKIGVIILSALIAHSAWHWMTERGAALAEFPVELPAFDRLFVAAMMRWTIVGLLLVALLYAMNHLYQRYLGRAAASPDRP